MVTTYNATRDLNSDTTLTDALDFFKSKLFLEINTIILGTIIVANPTTRRLQVQSLINGINSLNAPVTPPIIYDVPYGDIRGGNAGIIVDFQIGDNVIIGFCQRQIDVSKETGSSSTPALLRFFSLQDAIVLSHWSNSDPTIYLKITNSEVTIQATSVPVTIFTTGNLTINANNIALEGSSTVTGTLTIGTTVFNSSLPAIIDGQPFLTHIHSGVATGGSNTGPVT